MKSLNQIIFVTLAVLIAGCVESPFADKVYKCSEGMGAVDCISGYSCVYSPSEGSDWWCVKTSEVLTREDTTSSDTSGSTSGDTSGTTNSDTSGSTSGDTSGTTSSDTSGTTSGDTSPDGQTCTLDCSAGCGFDDGCEGVCSCQVGFECVNHQCIERDTACIKIDRYAHTLYPPAGLRVVFRVRDCDGYPTLKLTAADVEVINDATGQPFGAGGQRGSASAPNVPPGYGLYTILALDMSDSMFSTGAANQVLDSARLFVEKTVEQAPKGLKQRVGVIAFGRTDETQMVQDFTLDHEVLYQQLEALRGGQGRGVSNLYGAYMMAIREVLAEGSQLDLVERAVVVLTANTHEAGDEENLRAQAISAKQAGELDGSLTVFSVGIRGSYDEGKLREMASYPNYFQIAEDGSALSTVLDAFATQTYMIAESNYAVSICTPVELGNASLTVKVQAGEAATTQQISYNADEPSQDLTGDVASCDLNIIIDPCDGRVCGPGVLPNSQCGTCADTSYCGVTQCVVAPVTGAQEVFDIAGAYRFVRPGSFTMGSPTGELSRGSDETQHQVMLTRGFWLKETEVTQGEWQAVMGNNPSHFSSCGTTCPVEQVSWWDAVAYCNALSTAQSLTACYTVSGCTGTPGVAGYSCTGVTQAVSCSGYRLPTEAEWEYAYRAGTTTAFYNGPITQPTGTDPNLELIGWYSANSSSRTQRVAGKVANDWGLRDMSGNVQEWVWDWYGDYASAPQSDPRGASSGDARVIRGGTWYLFAHYCRAAQRNFEWPTHRDSVIGFRPARSF